MRPNALFKPRLLGQTSTSRPTARTSRPTARTMGETMNAHPATQPISAPQTPPLPHAKPESLGLSHLRLQRMSDAFKREVDKGTLPGATVMVARKGQIGWFDAIGIMMLLEEGHFLLSDPVAKFIPEFAEQKVGVEHNGRLELVPIKRPM